MSDPSEAPGLDEDNEKIPGTVFTLRQARTLKRAVIAMGLMLIIGFGALVTVIVSRMNRLDDKPLAATTMQRAVPAALAPRIDYRLEAGQRIVSVTLDGNRMALHISGGDGRSGEHIVVIDLASGKAVTRVNLPRK